MKQLLKVLTVHSGRDLIKYKSFFGLIFGLIVLDRVVHRWVPTRKPDLHLDNFHALGLQAAAYIFEQLPGKLIEWLTDWRAIVLVAVLFLLKQMISLWPSSDMRRMHRRERERFGIFAALAAIRWQQVLWDAIAVSMICGVVGFWSLTAFWFTRLGWVQIREPIWLYLLTGLLVVGAPAGMAGFSYSSKLAVLSRGRFEEKLLLFFRLFTDWRVFWTSRLFFTARIFLETIFVALIPLGGILFFDPFWVRMPIAALSATPVYAYLKMASFKFFLFTYGRFELVREEYPEYFQAAPAG
jgi:hypothetical protein